MNEKILEGKLKVIVEMLRCKGLSANYKVNDVFVILEIGAAHSNLDALLNLHNSQSPWAVSIDGNSTDTTVRFARFYPLDSMDMQALYDFLQYRLRDIPDEVVEISIEDVVNVLIEKGYCVADFKPGEIHIALTNLSSENTNYMSDTLPDEYKTDYVGDKYIIWSNADMRSKSVDTTIKDLYFWALSLEENKEDTKMITITAVVDELRKKGYSASVCDEKSFYVNRSGIMNAPTLPSGWITDVASSSGLAIRIVNYDINNDSLKDLMQWVEQIPHGSSALTAAKAFNYDSSNINPPAYPGMPSPFELFGMGANSFTVNNAANMPNVLMNFNKNTNTRKSDICDVMSIISDENGDLDVQKAKEVFGSCKKALKALFKCCKECIPATMDNDESDD